MSGLTIIYLVTGLGAGILLNWLVDVVPHWRVNQQDGRVVAPAGWRCHLVGKILWVRRRKSIDTTGKEKKGIWVEIGMLIFIPFLFFRADSFEEGAPLAIISFLFILIGLTDLKYRLILNKLLWGLIMIGTLFLLYRSDPSLLSMLGGGIVSGGLFLAAAAVSPSGLGGGDIKLGAVIGYLFGYPGLFIPLLIGVGSAGIFTIFKVMSSKSLKTKIPYGPFLCFGALVALIFLGL